jgi:hypothetical protein
VPSCPNRVRSGFEGAVAWLDRRWTEIVTQPSRTAREVGKSLRGKLPWHDSNPDPLMRKRRRPRRTASNVAT